MTDLKISRHTLLDSYHAKTLEQMAEAGDLNLTENGRRLRKADLLQKMADDFFGGERVIASLGRLNERERAVLDRLLLRGGTSDSSSFQRELIRAELVTEADTPPVNKNRGYYGRPVIVTYEGEPDRPKSTIFEDVIARLTYFGLVFSRDHDTFSSSGTPPKMRFTPSSILYIPPEIRSILPEPEPVPPPLADWQPAHTQHSEAETLLRDLYLYWDYVRLNEVALIQAGFVGKRGLKAINDILLQSDPSLDRVRREDETERLYQLRQLLELLGLIRQDRDGLSSTGSTALDIPAFWEKRRVEQLKACLAAWPKLIGSELTDKDAEQYHLSYQPARQALLSMLKKMPANDWLEAEAVLDQLRGENMDFLVPDRSGLENQRNKPYYTYYYSPHSGTYYYGQPEELLAKFDKFESRFVNLCLSGFLFQLGLIEFGYEAETTPPAALGARPVGWRAFRFTPAGRAVILGQGEAAPDERDEGKIIIQPNFQLLALGPVRLDLLARFDLFADREQVDRAAFQYRLSRESVYRGQQLGFAVEEVVRLLTEVGQVELPQNIRRSLEEWAGHHNRIVFRKGISLLQTADAGLLSQLLTNTPTDKLLARTLTETTALINDGQQPRLVSGLVEQGLFPAVSGPEAEAADHTVQIQPDGTIESIHAVPSLHLQGRMAQIAEQLDKTTWRLTPASVRRVGGSRAKIKALFEELDRLQRGSLPAELIEQIKAWGGYYGSAAVETLTLIEFSDKAAMEELSRHALLQPHLTPFPVDGRALAIVPDDRLEQVKQILADFGIAVKTGLKY